jgi:FkbM family methyltransferase
MTRIMLPSARFDFSGSPDDEYFCQAQMHADGLGALALFVQDHVRRDAVIADVGANIGLSALMLARLVPEGHVHAFEPSPATVAFLRRNIEANGVRNVAVVEAAVGAASGSVRFHNADHFTAGSRVVDEGGIEVPVVKLDDYAAEHRLRFNFIKIDTEGYEPWTLTGMAGQLRPDLPLWMEFNSLCLTACGANALAFACALARTFDAERVERDGTFSPMTDGNPFLADNMVHRGCVDDLVLRLRPGCALPSLAELTGQKTVPRDPSPLSDELLVRAELEAVHRSTSWRITSPLRALRRWFG